MTDATGVNAPRAVMLSIGELADRDGVSKPAVSRKVKNLIAKHGLAVERDGQGRVSRVNAAEYDHFRGRFGNPSKAQASQSSAPNLPAPEGNETYDEALRQKTWHEAERRRLELDELKGKLLRADRVAEALDACCDDMVSAVERLPDIADDLAAALVKDGPQGMRVILKQEVFRLRTEIARAVGTVSPLTEVDAESSPEAPNGGETKQ